MKTTRNLFFVLLVSMGAALAACSDTGKTDGPDPDPNPNPTEEGYFSLNLREGIVHQTKAPGDPNDVPETEKGKAEESNIRNIRVVLYNNTDGAIEYVFDYTGLTTNSVTGIVTGSSKLLSGSNTTSGIKTAAEFIKIQPYKMLVLVNLQEDASNDLRKKTTKGDAAAVTYSALLASEVPAGSTANLFINNGAAVTNDHFFMSNWQEAVQVLATDLKKTKTEAEAAPVKVYVDRAVAKVNFQEKAGGATVNTGVILSDMAWKLDITNKTSFYVRHKTNDRNGNPEANDTDLRHWFYAADPNMTNVSYERYAYNNDLGSKPSAITGPDYPKSKFNYFTKYAVTQTLGANVYEYCFENAMEAAEQYEDVTTAAILKLKYSVNRTALSDATSTAVTPGMKTINAGDPYFVWTRYAGTVHPEKYVFNAAGLELIRDLDTSHDVFAAYPVLVELHDFLVADKTTLESASYFGADYGRGNYTESEQYENGPNKLAYHHDLVSYYRVLIRHFNNALQPTEMGWGRYGVVRNNVYYLTLNKVDSPGDIDIPEPKGPDDKYAYLSVDIEVLPWVVRRQGAEL